MSTPPPAGRGRQHALKPQDEAREPRAADNADGSRNNVSDIARVYALDRLGCTETADRSGDQLDDDADPVQDLTSCSGS